MSAIAPDIHWTFAGTGDIAYYRTGRWWGLTRADRIVVMHGARHALVPKDMIKGGVMVALHRGPVKFFAETPEGHQASLSFPEPTRPFGQ